MRLFVGLDLPWETRQRLAVLAGNERSVRRLDRLRGELGDDPEAWLTPFLVESAGAR